MPFTVSSDPQVIEAVRFRIASAAGTEPCGSGLSKRLPEAPQWIMNPHVTAFTEAVSTWVASEETWIGTLVVLAILLRIPGWIASVHPRAKDPKRLFTAQQRRVGFARAEGRCEMSVFGFFRCSNRAAHGDHHYPHSHGGATSLTNFVAGCSRCNTRKSNRLPGFIQTALIEFRRRKYFPDGTSTKAGEWYRP